VALTVTAVLRASCALALIGGAAFGLLSTLPQPTEDKRLGVRVLQTLQHRSGTGSVMWFGNRRIVARCRPLPPWRQLVTLSDGTRFTLSGARATRLPSPDRRLLESTSPLDGQLLSAEADLAGSRQLFARELLGRLLHGHRVLLGPTRFRGVPAYRLQLGQDRPRVELVVDRRSLEPLAARYDGRWVKGTSSLLPSKRHVAAGC
jgi:hypothetical protein